ncbi:hypothetical protein GCM10011402_07940 [Paracoccus acridae]|uniref:Uncharacterized protein n=1 Tax=Paracoccus acridae TaxID=1795310 RepID=A0ABQ1VDZ8_9RHOB|nr:hypothetical protein GCM10011402_07940 [Paracoccus acridae]
MAMAANFARKPFGKDGICLNKHDAKGISRHLASLSTGKAHAPDQGSPGKIGTIQVMLNRGAA